MTTPLKKSATFTSSCDESVTDEHPLVVDFEVFCGLREATPTVRPSDVDGAPDVVKALPNPATLSVGDAQRLVATSNLVVAGSLTRHPIAEAYDLPRTNMYAALVRDIEKCGLRIAIVLYQGKVLDGGERLRACLELGVTPIFTEYTGDDARGEFVSLNQHRRHLTPAQVAAMEALNADPEFLAKHGGRRGQAAEVQLATVRSRALAAGCSERSLSQAIRINREDPAALRLVRDGGVSLDAAEQLACPARVKKPKPDVHAECKEKIARLEKHIGTTDENDPAYVLVSPNLAKQLRREIEALRGAVAQRDFIIHMQEAELARHKRAGHVLPPRGEEE